MNVLVLGGRIVGPALAHELVRAFVARALHGEERHVRRLEKVKAIEKRTAGTSAGSSQRHGASTEARSAGRGAGDIDAVAVANPVAALQQYGQSVWLDFIRRSLIAERRAEAAGRRRRASAASPRTPPSSRRPSTAATTTRPPSRRSRRTRASPPKEVYERLADRGHPGRGRRAARRSTTARRRSDGYVSLEVSPDLANDTEGTLAEARRLWKAVARPNVMIKVPATPEGVPAIRHAHRRGHQRQRHAALRPRGLRGGGPGLHRGPGGARRKAAGRSPRRERRQLLREPHRHRWWTR